MKEDTLIILEEYRSSKNSTLEAIEEENNFKLHYTCNCGNDTYFIELSEKDPSSGNRTLNLICSQCHIEVTDWRDY